MCVLGGEVDLNNKRLRVDCKSGGNEYPCHIRFLLTGLARRVYLVDLGCIAAVPRGVYCEPRSFCRTSAAWAVLRSCTTCKLFVFGATNQHSGASTRVPAADPIPGTEAVDRDPSTGLRARGSGRLPYRLLLDTGKLLHTFYK